MLAKSRTQPEMAAYLRENSIFGKELVEFLHLDRVFTSPTLSGSGFTVVLVAYAMLRVHGKRRKSFEVGVANLVIEV